ncbi:MAG: VOC family protein [Bacillota bacterium]
MFKFNALIPELSVSDIDRSLHFYQNILSFKLEYERKDDKFVMLSLNDSQIMIEEVNGHWDTGALSYPYGRGINFQIAVDNVEELYRKINMHNYPIKLEMQESWYMVNGVPAGQKEFLIMDPDGYLLRFAESIEPCEV